MPDGHVHRRHRRSRASASATSTARPAASSCPRRWAAASPSSTTTATASQDLLFVNSGLLARPRRPKDPPPTLALYRNKGDGKFEDVTAEAGLERADVRHGRLRRRLSTTTAGPDLFVTCVGKHHLFRNVDGKKFEDVTDAAGVGGGPDLPGRSSRTSSSNWKDADPVRLVGTFLDYDGDGKLDLFVCHYVTWSPAIDLSVERHPGRRRPGVRAAAATSTARSAPLYRNVDGKRFEDVSDDGRRRGVPSRRAPAPNARQRPVGKSLGVIVCDPDDDGWPDLIVANDNAELLLPQRRGTDGGRSTTRCGGLVGVALRRRRHGPRRRWASTGASSRPACSPRSSPTSPTSRSRSCA